MAPDAALRELAALLRVDSALISEHVCETEVAPALGELVAAGPRAAKAPGEYSLLVEAIREGYLLHYGNPRIVRGLDADLALLAGDYLYAIGLERLAALGDLEAVHELSDLISLSALIHDGGESLGSGEGGVTLAAPLWLSSGVAVGAGASERHEEAKRSVRVREPSAGALLWRAALDGAESGSMTLELERAGDAVGFASRNLSELA